MNKLKRWFENQHGLTQEALGERIGVTQGRVSQLLAGATPSIRLAARIAVETGGYVTANDYAEPARDEI